LDSLACQEFLRTGIIYEDRTFHSEVRKLGPASVFRFVRGELSTQERYWQISDVTPEALDGRQAVEALASTLCKGAQQIERHFKRPVCDLTGGYDSRAVAAAFLMGKVPFSTTVSGPENSADVIISKGIAGMLGLPHSHAHPSHDIGFEQAKQAFVYTDGEYDLVDYARILKVHQNLSDRFDISINGSFGEVARGYWWELLWPHAGARSPVDSTKLANLRYASTPNDASIFNPESKLDLTKHFKGIIDRTNKSITHLPNTMQMDHAY